MPWSARGEKLYEGESMNELQTALDNALGKWTLKEFIPPVMSVRMPAYNDRGVAELDDRELAEIDNALVKANDEIARLRGALQFIANHTAEPGTALDTVAKFAAATLDEVK